MKVSVDYDGTLSTPKGQNLVKRLMSEGKEVYVITRRNSSMPGGIYGIAEKLGIPRNRIHFTNGFLKWKLIKRLGIDTHYDNNQNEIDKIKENTNARGILFN